MKQHRFQQGEDIEAIARQYGFYLPATIWNDSSNDALRELRKSPYALATGDLINIPDLHIESVDAADERRHVYQLNGLTRPAFYSRLMPGADNPAARFAPVYSQPGAIGFDISFVPHLAGALTHVAAAHEGARFQALFTGRGKLAEAPLLQSAAYLLIGNKSAWVADALARHDDADLRVLLVWVANVLGIPCDPGRAGESTSQGFGHALKRLRSALAIKHGASVSRADMELRPEEDLPIIYDAMEETLRAATELSIAGIALARAKIQFLSPLWVDLTRNDGIEGSTAAASLDLVLFDDQVVKATRRPIHPLLAKAAAFAYQALLPKQTVTTFNPLRPYRLDFEDIHFGAERSVFLPTELTAAGPDEPWGITGADVLVAALVYARSRPTQTLIVTGHTDSTSSKLQNFTLAQQRARSVKLLLTGMNAMEEWAQHAHAEGTTDDANEYLRWAAERFGYGSWPSAFDSPDPARDRRALLAFRRRFNLDVSDYRAMSINHYSPAFTKQLQLTGPLSKDDWRGFFQMVQRYISDQSVTTGRIPTQRSLKFGADALGCGESHPFNLEQRERKRLALYPDENLGENPADRRVELIFLDADEFALLPSPMLCHPTPDAGACKPELCMLYDQKLFDFQRLSAVPQRGKIEIIERTVMRDKRLFTDEEQELVEEVSGDFTPILGEKVRILVRVTPPYYPFEGEPRLAIGRRTSGDQPVSRVADIAWRAVDGNTLLTLTKPTLLVFEWDGHATQKVPREYSDRDISYFEQKIVPIPMMEMNPGQRAKHGPYVIELVQLLEKDRTLAVQYAPDEQERDELTMVVQPTIEIAFRDGSTPHDIQNLLSEVGFGEGHKPDLTPETFEIEETAPKAFAVALEQAIVRRVVRFYTGINLRFIATNGWPKTTGLLCEVECEAAFSGGESADFMNNGVTDLAHSVGGLKVFQNLFLWFDQNEQPKGEGDSRVRTRAFLYGPLTDEAGGAALLKAFGRLGFPADRRVVRRLVKNVPGQLPNWVEKFFLEGGPNTPRTVDGDEIVGLVDATDAANSAVRVDPSSGVVTVATTNPSVVPPRRASDIARAINACAAWVAYIAAHELGHLLGASVTQSQKKKPASALSAIPMPDGSTVGPYMDQDEEGEDPKPTSAQLMSPSAHSFSQRLGLTGPAMTLLPKQSEYLRAVAPFAADFAKPNEP